MPVAANGITWLFYLVLEEHTTSLLTCCTKWWQVCKRRLKCLLVCLCSIQHLLQTGNDALRLKWDLEALTLPVTLHTSEAFFKQWLSLSRKKRGGGSSGFRFFLLQITLIWRLWSCRKLLLPQPVQHAEPCWTQLIQTELVTPQPLVSLSIILVNDLVSTVMFKWKAVWQWGLSPMCCNAVNTVMVSAMSSSGQQRVSDWNVTQQRATSSSSVCPAQTVICGWNNVTT